LQLPAAEEPMPMRTQTLRLGDAAEPAGENPPVVTPPPTPPAATASAPAPNGASPEPRETSDATRQARATPSAESRPAASQPAKPAATGGGEWIVQLGVFSEEANARGLAQRSGTFGYKAEVSSYRANGRTLYRVRVGPTATRAQADATASALRAHGLTDARVLAAD